MKSMIPALFYQLLVFAGFACQAPTFGQLKTKSISSFKGMQVNPLLFEISKGNYSLMYKTVYSLHILSLLNGSRSTMFRLEKNV